MPQKPTPWTIVCCLLAVSSFAPALFAQARSINFNSLTVSADGVSPETIVPGADGSIRFPTRTSFANREMTLLANISWDSTSRGNQFSIFCPYTSADAPDGGGSVVFGITSAAGLPNVGSQTLGPRELKIVERRLVSYTFHCEINELGANGNDAVSPETVTFSVAMEGQEFIKIVGVNPTSDPSLPGSTLRLTADIEALIETDERGATAVVELLDSAGNSVAEQSRQVSQSFPRNGNPANVRSLRFDFDSITVPPGGISTVRATLRERDTGNPIDSAEAGLAQADFTIDHIEVVQVVQDEFNSIPLVKGKPFMIRVFPKLVNPGPEQSGVPAIIQIKDDTGITEFDADGRDTIVTENPLRGDKRHSYNISISADTAARLVGPVMVAAGINLEEAVEETNLENNTGQTGPLTFEERRPLRIRYVPVCIQIRDDVVPGNPLLCPSTDLGDLGGFTRAVFPVAEDLFEFLPLESPNLVLEWDQTQEGQQIEDFFDLIERAYFDQLAASEGREEFDQIVGIAPAVLRPEGSEQGIGTLGAFFSAEGLAGGVNQILGAAATKWAGHRGRVSILLDGQRELDIGAGRTAITLAHEIGHNLGLRHTAPASNSGEGQSGRERSRWPFPDATIQEHGAIPSVGAVLVGKPADDPGVWNDLMGPGATDNEWISPFHYIWLFEGDFQPTAEQPSFLRPERTEQTPAEFAFISARVDREGFSGELRTVRRFTGVADPDASQAGGEFCLQFIDASGAMLGENCFPLDFKHAESGEDLDSQSFSKLVSVPAGTARISLQRLGAELDAASASATVPAVEMLAPAAGDRWEDSTEQTIRWAGTDADGDSLRYSVLYSADGGTQWRSLVTDLVATEYRFDPAQIRGGPNVRFRVTVSDGFHQSESEVGPVDVVQQPALVASETPVDIGEAVVGQPVLGKIPLRNTGTGPLTVTAVASDSELFEVVTADFPLIISAGAGRNVSVRFTPTAVGQQAAALTVSSDATGQAQTAIAIQGSGTDGQTPRLAIGSEAIRFPVTAIGATQTAAVMITNASLVDLEVTWDYAGSPAITAEADAATFTVTASDTAYIRLSFSPSAAGRAAGTVTVRSNDPGRPEVAVAVSGEAVAAPVVAPAPAFGSGSVVNAANFTVGPIAPEMWVTLFGQNLADSLVVASGGLPTSLGGTSVSIRDSQGAWRPARTQLVAPSQINLLVPQGVALGDALIEVINDGRTTATIAVAAVAPGMFSANASGQGPAAATVLRVAADGTRTEIPTFTTDANPRENAPIALSPGSDQVFLSFFGTGFRFQSTVSATVGGVSVPILGAVAQGQFDGLDQVVVGPLPPELAGRGEVDVVFVFDGIAANIVTVDTR